jgi:hypothetical protein
MVYSDTLLPNDAQMPVGSLGRVILTPPFKLQAR